MLLIKRIRFKSENDQRTRTSLTSTPTDIDDSPFSPAVSSSADLHLEFVLRNTDGLETSFKDIVVGGHVPQ
jgi:hypothetical protein